MRTERNCRAVLRSVFVLLPFLHVAFHSQEFVRRNVNSERTMTLLAEEGKSHISAEKTRRKSERAPMKAWLDTLQKYTTGKSKPKLVSGPIVRLVHQSTAKRHQFGNCDYYKVLHGRWAERASLARSPYKFKMMTFHGTLVCDSENWSTYKTWFVLSSGLFYSCFWSNLSRAAVPWQRSITVNLMPCGRSSPGCKINWKGTLQSIFI